MKKGIGFIACFVFFFLGLAFVTDTFVLPAKTDSLVGVPLMVIGGLGFIGFLIYGSQGTKKQ